MSGSPASKDDDMVDVDELDRRGNDLEQMGMNDCTGESRWQMVERVLCSHLPSLPGSSGLGDLDVPGFHCVDQSRDRCMIDVPIERVDMDGGYGANWISRVKALP
ncbi:hypothetical protein N7492_004179 [Penicillium capsulatum]|uniref:Uncharacterized protein n=1 Tax=Penicillium capsulatum TaxID=69766 RepID=A0A9W9LXL9_9EURO|nr:hypothetical protein N7492_004179 [Penicillium capsulatum]KAJ6121251.1 hypothetical protein N7512_003716 [Penicillium capsulatum]